MSATWVYNDGGREMAGYKGTTGDCVVRAIAIATEQPYRIVYDALNAYRNTLRQTKYIKQSSSRTGTHRAVYDAYLKNLGWQFYPTMGIGTGCKVHLVAEELPPGRLIVRLSRHLTAMVNGVIHDIYNPQRGCTILYQYGKPSCVVPETRCVYGYYRQARAR